MPSKETFRKMLPALGITSVVGLSLALGSTDSQQISGCDAILGSTKFQDITPKKFEDLANAGCIRVTGSHVLTQEEANRRFSREQGHQIQ